MLVTTNIQTMQIISNKCSFSGRFHNWFLCKRNGERCENYEWAWLLHGIRTLLNDWPNGITNFTFKAIRHKFSECLECCNKSNRLLSLFVFYWNLNFSIPKKNIHSALMRFFHEQKNKLDVLSTHSLFLQAKWKMKNKKTKKKERTKRS